MKQDIKKNVLEKIKEEKVEIKPKGYFRTVKSLFYILSLALLIAAVYVFNLMIYLPRRAAGVPRAFGNIGLKDYFSIFPWPLILVGAGFVGLLIYIYRRYEGGYKKHLVITILVIFFGVLVSGVALAKTNLNEKLEEKRPGMRRFYQWNEENFVPRGPRERIHQQPGMQRGPRFR